MILDSEERIGILNWMGNRNFDQREVQEGWMDLAREIWVTVVVQVY